MKFEQLLELIQNTRGSELLNILKDNKRIAGLNGVIFDIKYITTYKEVAVKYLKNRIKSRCAIFETKLYKYC